MADTNSIEFMCPRCDTKLDLTDVPLEELNRSTTDKKAYVARCEVCDMTIEIEINISFDIGKLAGRKPLVLDYFW